MVDTKKLEFPEMDWDTIKKRPLSYSALKELKKSPRHFIYYRNKVWTPPTDVQVNGHLVEYLIAEVHIDKMRDDVSWKNKFYEMPNIRNQGAANKMEIAKHITAAEGKMIIKVGMLEKAMDAVEVAMANPQVRQLIDNKTRTQTKLEWRERIEFEGKDYYVPMIGYSDFESSDGGVTPIVVDIKTTTDASADGFARQISKMFYHLQMGTYSIGYHKAQYKFPRFQWLAIETSPPYGANVIELSSKDLEIAKAEVKGLIWGFVKAMQENRWKDDYHFWLLARDVYRYYIPKYLQSSHLNFMTDES